MYAWHAHDMTRAGELPGCHFVAMTCILYKSWPASFAILRLTNHLPAAEDVIQNLPG